MNRLQLSAGDKEPEKFNLKDDSNNYRCVCLCLQEYNMLMITAKKHQDTGQNLQQEHSKSTDLCRRQIVKNVLYKIRVQFTPSFAI